jgi:hypothetical protein
MNRQAPASESTSRFQLAVKLRVEDTGLVANSPADLLRCFPQVQASNRGKARGQSGSWPRISRVTQESQRYLSSLPALSEIGRHTHQKRARSQRSPTVKLFGGLAEVAMALDAPSLSDVQRPQVYAWYPPTLRDTIFRVCPATRVSCGL